MIRATKALTYISFNLKHYQPFVKTPEQVAEKLDRLAVETVILDEYTPRPQVLSYHTLLRKAVTTSALWKQCAGSGPFSAYCRIKPPLFPPEPLTIDLKWHLGRSISEQ